MEDNFYEAYERQKLQYSGKKPSWGDKWSRNPPRNPPRIGTGARREFIGIHEFDPKAPRLVITSNNINLQRLLPEIRTIIFRYILQPQGESRTFITNTGEPAYYLLGPVQSDKRRSVKHEGIRCYPRNTSILSTCKWIHAEAATMLYRETKFTFESFHTCNSFFETISQKYLDVIKDIKITAGPIYFPGHNAPVVRNLKILYLPLYPNVYSMAKDAVMDGFLMEELVGIRQLLLLRGLTAIVIEDPEDISRNHPELLDIKRKLDTLIKKTVKQPRKTCGKQALGMDTFGDRRLYKVL